MILLRALILGILSFSLLQASEVSFRADQVVFSNRGNEVVMNLQGSVWVKSPKYTIRSGELLIWGEKQERLEGSSGVSLTNEKETLAIKGNSFSLDREKENLVVRGQVDLADTENDLNLSAMEVRTQGSGERVIAFGAVRLTRKGVYAEAETLHFDKEKNTLDLIGSARLERKGEHFFARRIWVNLDNDQLILEDQVSGQVQLEKEDKQTP